jgi:hypothetical protein
MGSVGGITEVSGCGGLEQMAFRATGRALQVAEAKTEMITDLHVAPVSLNFSTTVDVEATLPAVCEMMLLTKKYPDDAKNQ